MTSAFLTKTSDTLGALASGMCLVHCVATPFVFVAQTCSAVCCASAPTWWRLIDVAFAAIACWMVYQSARASTKLWIKYGLWIAWATLVFVIFNEQAQFVPLSNKAIYVPSLALISLHLYNKKYGTCSHPPNRLAQATE
ncbi:MAG: MerC domain-containing protein [Bacteroidota bacterium]